MNNIIYIYCRNWENLYKYSLFFAPLKEQVLKIQGIILYIKGKIKCIIRLIIVIFKIWICEFLKTAPKHKIYIHNKISIIILKGKKKALFKERIAISLLYLSSFPFIIIFFSFKKFFSVKIVQSNIYFIINEIIVENNIFFK